KPASKRVFIDNKEPVVVNQVMSPEFANSTSTVRLALSFHEPVKEVEISADDLVFTRTGDVEDKQLFIYEHQVSDEDDEKQYAVNIKAVDLAGNALETSLEKALIIDKTIPDIKVEKCTISSSSGVSRNGIAAASTGHNLEIVLEVDVEKGIVPSVTLGGTLLEEACAAPDGSLCFAYSVSESDSEGYKMVGIEAADAAGNVYNRSVDIENCFAQFDFTGPVLATAVISRIPDYVPARDHNTKTLSFSLTDPFTDEAVIAQINLFADEELNSEEIEITGFDFGEPLEVIDNYASFERMLDNGITAGTKNLSVTWQDVLGNESTKAVDWKMFIDKSEPDPSVIDMKKVLYTRKPWGTDDTGGVPKFSVAGDTGSVTDSNIATIVAYNELGSIIGNTTVSGGSFSIPALTGGDITHIYLNPVKKSGLKNSGLGLLVTEGIWYATMGGKTPKDIYANPNTFYVNNIFSNKLNQNVDSTDEPALAGQFHIITTKGRTTWTNMKAGDPKPSKRALSATVYDSIRGKLVLFGGSTDSGEDETWEWDGVSWTKLDPVHKPTPRESPAMVFDSARGKTVLFGGMGADNETWEWDGSDWTMINSIDKPSVRFGHAMTYDSIRGKTVLFGGAYDGPCSNETWEWDGNNWELMSPVGDIPSARAFHSMVFDSSSGKTIMFGGGS
ncbi:MAG TPA: kelch repeat-containing protein, partial [bacterium]|nr:kelch repeat-containing protein [bacterium]